MPDLIKEAYEKKSLTLFLVFAIMPLLGTALLSV
jgi:hypothetical protein